MRDPCHNPIRRRGFTLIEMVLSASITAVLMGAIGSVFVIASRALPGKADAAESAASAAQVLDRLAMDIADAIEMSGGGANSITLTVPDRDGDLRNDVLNYAWSGRVGDPLTLVFNGGAPVTVASNVRSFLLGYDVVTWTDPHPSKTTKGAEALLLSQSAAPKTSPVDSGNWSGQVIHPSLPSNTWSWTPSKARVMLRTDGGADVGATVGVRLYAADSTDRPTGVMIDEAQILETSLTATPQWYSFTFPKAQPIANGAAVCLVVVGVSGSHPGKVSYDDHDPPVGSAMLDSSNSGSTWKVITNNSLTFELYGFGEGLVAASAGAIHTERVRMTLQLGTGTSTIARASAALRNLPEVK